MPVTLAYLGVILIWSTTPLALRWSVEGGDFAFAVLARMAIGALLAGALLVLAGIPFPRHRRALSSYLAGGLGLFGAMGFTYWAARYVNSGMISVMFGLSPLLTGLLAARWLGERAFTPLRLAGMVLGVAGLAVIFLRGDEAGGDHATAGLAALLVGVAIYSASLVWVKRIGDDSPPLATTAGAQAVSLPLFGLVWLLADGHLPVALPPRAGAAILYLGVFGSVLGFALYYYVIKHLDTGRVALITLVTPVLALLLGHALDGEVVTAPVWLGTALIGVGLLLHHWEGARRREAG